MLVLSRKVTEGIVISDDITVTVLEVQGQQVKLGIVAPACVPVHRREVYDKIKRGGNDCIDGISIF